MKKAFRPFRLALLTTVYVLSFAIPANLFADAPTPTATKKPAAKPNPVPFYKQHFTDRVKIFRDENKALKTSNNIVFVGDSITEGFNVAKNFPGHHVLNRGIGSDVIGNALAKGDNRGILRRMDESVFDCKPSEVFILIGINDLGAGHKPETIEAGYRDLLQAIKTHSPDLRVHIQSLMPTRDNYAKHNANINDVNKRLQKLAKEFGYDYVDLHSKMTDDKGELKKELTPEGLHLKPEGYRVWKAEIDRILSW
jgi:lysophospholipase L1-like esterase